MALGKVLLIDDEADIQVIVKMALEFTDGCRVLVAGSAADGIRLAMDEAPDVILLDAMMPKLDGYEACRQLKKDPKTQRIPIIFLTARAQQAEMERGMGLGAAGYLTKPFDPMRLAAEIRDILHRAGPSAEC